MKKVLEIGMSLALTTSAVVACAGDLYQSNGGNKPTSGVRMTEGQFSGQDVAEKGRSLRAAIDKKFEELSQANLIKGGSSNRNILRDIVIEYIPSGISFDDAEIILRSAGFDVAPRGEILPQIFRGNFGVYAAIDPYSSGVLRKVIISVILRPKSQNDWSQVAELETETVIISL